MAELAVAAALMLGSDGRLSPFVPLSDDHGVDLVVADKATGRLAPVQVKSWSALPLAAGRVQFDVKAATAHGGRDTLLVCVHFDPEAAAIRASWVMAMDRVSDLVKLKSGTYALRPSVRPNSRDKFRRYRHATVPSMVRAVMDSLGG